jgi:hypothetical protein
MPDILHRISIDAAQEHVHDLIATTKGVARWWTGCPLSGESSDRHTDHVRLAPRDQRQDDAAVQPRPLG